MGPYIYGSRNGIHILDLTQTVPLLEEALRVIRDTVAEGGRILFVGTKRQAQKAVADAAERSAQFYMNHRWLGGTLTNWQTVSQSIARLKQIDEAAERGFEGLTKKERLGMEREQAKLQASLAASARWAACPTSCRHRREQGGPRHPGGPEAGHPGRGRSGHQLLAQGRDFVIPATTTRRGRSSSTATSPRARRSRA
jgi:hypothetical protein